MRTLAMLALAAALPAQVTWTTNQVNARHDGYQPVVVPTSSLAQRWEVYLGIGSINQVAIAEGKVFASGPDKKLFALDSSTGAQLWSRAYPTAFSVNPPAYAGGRVYMQTGNHGSDTWLRCFDAATGTQIFQAAHTAQWERYLAPTIVGGKVYLNGGYYGGMYGFDGTTGQQLWFVNTLPQYDQWTPAVEDNVCYAYVGGDLYARSATTGASLYSIDDPGFQWQGWSMNLAPVLGGQFDAFVAHSSRLIRFDLITRTISYVKTGGYTGQPAIRNGVVYAIAGSSLRALDQVTGNDLWSWTHTSPLNGAVTVTNSHVFVQSNTGIHLIGLQTGQLAWTAPRTGQLSVGEGAFYIGGTNGTLTCYGFATLPNPVALSQTRTHYTAPPVTISITGSAFTAGANLQVLFGGTPASDVTVVSDNLVTCVVPQRGPGLVDVRVENTIGQHTMAGAFAYTPALHSAGILAPGGTIQLSCIQEPGEMLFCGYGDTATSIPVPPFTGNLGILPPTLLFVLPGWPHARFDLNVPIPATPAVSGTQVTFQSLVGADVPQGIATFSNVRTVVVQ